MNVPSVRARKAVVQAESAPEETRRTVEEAGLPVGDQYTPRLVDTVLNLAVDPKVRTKILEVVAIYPELQAELVEALEAQAQEKPGPLDEVVAKQMVEAAGAVYAGWRVKARQVEEQPYSDEPVERRLPSSCARRPRSGRAGEQVGDDLASFEWYAGDMPRHEVGAEACSPPGPPLFADVRSATGRVADRASGGRHFPRAEKHHSRGLHSHRQVCRGAPHRRAVLGRKVRHHRVVARLWVARRLSQSLQGPAPLAAHAAAS